MSAPAFQFYPQDFLVGTQLMLAAEVGGYVRLLCHQWDQGGIPNDDEMIAKLTGCDSVSVARIKEKFRVRKRDGKLINARLEKVRTEQNKYRAKQKANANARWSKRKPNTIACATAEASQCSSPSPPSLTPNHKLERESSADRPCWAEVQMHAVVIGLAEWKARDWFDEMEGCGWIDYNHRSIESWKPVLNRVRTKWEADGRPSGPPSTQTRGARPLSPLDMRTIITAKEGVANALREKHAATGPLGSTWSDEQARQQFMTLRREIRELNQKLANAA